MLTIDEAIAAALQHQQAGRIEQAAELYRAVLARHPDHPDAMHYLGLLLIRAGRCDQGLAAIRRSIELSPNTAHYRANLAAMLRDGGDLDGAIAECARAVQFDDTLVQAHLALAECLLAQRRMDEAAAAFQRVCQLDPADANAHTLLGKILKNQGRLDEAIECQRRAMQASPDDATFHGNLLFAMWLDPRLAPEQIFQEHRRWARRFADPLTDAVPPHANDPAPNRRLRIGYVSPDLRNHVIGRYIEPVLASHDHGSFEIICYSGSDADDQVTARLRAVADVWRTTSQLDHQQLAQQIRDDRIDILVDLSLHTAANRLMTFARKPAPVQVTYLGYPATSGMRAMDYRITDVNLDPPGMTEHLHTEQLVRLPENYWCYPPPPFAPEPDPLPAARRDHVTFGSLNNFCKVNADVLRLWAGILHSVPRSRLAVLIKGDEQNNRSIRPLLEQHGIPSDRLELLPTQSQADYLRLYLDIDISLDPFPYNGHTTSLDSLWMNVPLVTLAGRTAVSRAGVDLLTNVGLPQLIAQSPDQYLDIATRLASDLPALAELRAGLRDRVQRSPLLDYRRFTRNLESAYRRMWQSWCASHGCRNP